MVADFNPHACKRRDPYCSKRGLQLYWISIHTPARGVTSTKKANIIIDDNFNPHACKRRDFRMRGIPVRGGVVEFQSTRLQEA